MKVQYFGDVKDYRKFALLRALSEVGQFKAGVSWMLTEADESGHGDHRSYLKRPDKWRGYDPVLFDALTSVPSAPTISDLHRIEKEGLIGGATFFDDFALDALQERDAYHARCMTTLNACDLAFFDPDNGLEVKSVAKGRKGSSKYAYLDELADHYRTGRSCLIYQHFPRHVTREHLIITAAARLRHQATEASIWSFVTPHVVFLLAARPEHEERVVKGAAVLAERQWLPEFFTAVRKIEANYAAPDGVETETATRQT